MILIDAGPVVALFDPKDGQRQHSVKGLKKPCVHHRLQDFEAYRATCVSTKRPIVGLAPVAMTPTALLDLL